MTVDFHLFIASFTANLTRWFHEFFMVTKYAVFFFITDLGMISLMSCRLDLVFWYVDVC